MTETLANGYSSESTRRELSNEYQEDRVSMVFQESCILVVWTKVASASEGLKIVRLVLDAVGINGLIKMLKCLSCKSNTEISFMSINLPF